MILNLEKTTEYLVNWLVERLEEAGARGCVVGVSGGVDSAVTLAIAARAARKRGGACVGVIMPCHSSEGSTSRGEETIKAVSAHADIPIERQFIPLETAFTSIVESLRFQLEAGDELDVKAFGETQAFSQSALRSCLRAPVLDYVAKCYNALVVGTGNRDEDEIFRYYQKRGDGAVDNNPLAALHKSEVYQLAAHLGVPQSVIDAPPTADLLGPDANQTDEGDLGVTYAEIEWLTREDDEYGIVFDTVIEFAPFEDIFDMAQKARKAPYTERERMVIEAGIRAYKNTMHKAQPPHAPRRSNLVFEGLLC